MGLHFERVARRVDALVPHLPLALATGAILLASALVKPTSWPLPVCTFKRWTGYPCLFCGMTRSFAAFAHGNFRAAFVECPAGALFFVFTAAVFAVNAYALLARKRARWVFPPWASGKRVLIAASILLALNWIYRIASGLR